MVEYVDKQELLGMLEKKIKADNERRMAVVDRDFIDLVNDATVISDIVEVVRCKDCNIPHNKWTGCPHLNGLIPPPNFFCAFGERRKA